MQSVETLRRERACPVKKIAYIKAAVTQRPEEPNYDVELPAAPNGKIQSKVKAYDHSGRSSGVNQGR